MNRKSVLLSTKSGEKKKNLKIADLAKNPTPTRYLYVI